MHLRYILFFICFISVNAQRTTNSHGFKNNPKKVVYFIYDDVKNINQKWDISKEASSTNTLIFDSLQNLDSSIIVLNKMDYKRNVYLYDYIGVKVQSWVSYDHYNDVSMIGTMEWISDTFYIETIKDSSLQIVSIIKHTLDSNLLDKKLEIENYSNTKLKNKETRFWFRIKEGYTEMISSNKNSEKTIYEVIEWDMYKNPTMTLKKRNDSYTIIKRVFYY